MQRVFEVKRKDLKINTLPNGSHSHSSNNGNVFIVGFLRWRMGGEWGKFMFCLLFFSDGLGF